VANSASENLPEDAQEWLKHVAYLNFNFNTILSYGVLVNKVSLSYSVTRVREPTI
jgi:hypothetical protein